MKRKAVIVYELIKYQDLSATELKRDKTGFKVAETLDVKDYAARGGTPSV